MSKPTLFVLAGSLAGEMDFGPEFGNEYCHKNHPWGHMLDTGLLFVESKAFKKLKHIGNIHASGIVEFTGNRPFIEPYSRFIFSAINKDGSGAGDFIGSYFAEPYEGDESELVISMFEGDWFPKYTMPYANFEDGLGYPDPKIYHRSQI